MSTLTDHECKGQTLVDRIRHWGETDPDTPAFIFWSSSDRRVFSRKEIFDLSCRFASNLVEKGIKPKDVICIVLPNSPERIVVEFGIHLAGAASMNGQLLRADGEDFIAALIKVKCSCVILDPEITSGAWTLIAQNSDNRNVYDHYAECRSKAIPNLKTVIFCRPIGKEKSLLETLNTYTKFIYEDTKSQDMATIFTTSGSTGYSKLVPHTHERILMFGFTDQSVLNLKPSYTYFNMSPLGWIGGFPSVFLFTGCTRIVVDESAGVIRDMPGLIWNILCQEQVYASCMLPSMMASVHDKRCLSSFPKSQFKLHVLYTGGQPIQKGAVEIAQHLAEEVFIVYGSTEVGLICSINVKNIDDFEDFKTGYTMSGVTAKIVDETFDSVPPMIRGEVFIKSPALCDTYIGKDAPQEDFLPGGWFRTGDTGYMREDGCLFVEGRSSDAIMHGGYILYPSWLEKMLIKCPGVKDVVIVPVPDKYLHHEICACVKLDADEDTVLPSAEDIINFNQNQMLLDKSSNLNVVPKYVVFFDDFPETNTGKTHRKALAVMAQKRLNL